MTQRSICISLAPNMSADTRTAVLIAAYNAEPTLERAVASALAEPEAAEICIVDDGSTDATFSLAQSLAARDTRVLVRRLDANAGPSTARNFAIEASASPWLTILDADDYVVPGRLALLHTLAHEADFVGDALIRMPSSAEPAWAVAPLSARALDLTTFLLGNLGGAAGPLDLGYLKPLMRRSFLDAHGLRYRTDMRLGEDYELYARALALDARFLVCGEAGYISVERTGSLSKAHSEADLLRLRDCDEAVAALRPLTPPEQNALRRHWNSVDRRLQWRRLISAVKARDAAMAVSAFRSVDAAFYLCGKLAEQAWLRSTGRGPRRPLSTGA
ncbi:MAG TPA: glycosyltransferase family 2 protein [Vitreimonas sp.]|uniref:glycosyltransferase family 2 protein n=1 Tax=Vitreimonas sp. TaxID=3069702 RepID=UPI002D4DE74D|nr:glycosyltransferase family 2 protein [Vitreimonas sp.]HYD88948.1 glycosyltransferase family 2 protein [Vitreimonas sp.]